MRELMEACMKALADEGEINEQFRENQSVRSDDLSLSSSSVFNVSDLIYGINLRI